MNPMKPVISNILAIQDKAKLHLYLAVFELPSETLPALSGLRYSAEV